MSGSRADRPGLEILSDSLSDHHYDLMCVDLVEDARHFSPNDLVTFLASAANDTITRASPDLVILSGDRYETLITATVATTLNIPIAHLGGGDRSRGSQDDAFRDAITMLSHLHFVTNPDALYRLINVLGVNGARVHNVGEPVIDLILKTKLMSREEVYDEFGLPSDSEYVLVAFQPATLADSKAECYRLLSALNEFKFPYIFTTVNSDAGSREIDEMISEFCAQGQHRLYVSLEHRYYLSAMKHCKFMIGNSSSGLIEAPSLRKLFINIGKRQSGRLKPGNVVSVDANAHSIVCAIRDYSFGLNNVDNIVNPYGDGHACEKIATVLNRIKNPKTLLERVC